MYLRDDEYDRTLRRMSPPAERLAAWIQSQGWTRDVAAERLGFGRDMLDSILRGRRMPGRLLANTIERQSSPWEHGPIRSVEWDAVEIARKREREQAGGNASDADPEQQTSEPTRAA